MIKHDNFKKVTEEELQAFVETYPKKLVRDVFHAYEPALVTLNDFTLGFWPDSVVAYHRHDSNEFYVLKEVKS